jgi:hypothetical protein
MDDVQLLFSFCLLVLLGILYYRSYKITKILSLVPTILNNLSILNELHLKEIKAKYGAIKEISSSSADLEKNG